MDYGFTLVSCYNSNYYYVVLRGDLSGGIHKKTVEVDLSKERC